MHPAPSVILFTTLSGMGLGLLAFLGLGLAPSHGLAAFLHWGLAYGLTVAGLLTSTFHLGHPERAWRAFSQWRSSWLSREGIAAVATLLILAPVALSDIAGAPLPSVLGWIGAAGALATAFTTSMIYAQLKTVPRWNSPTVPALFLGYVLTGGALLAGLTLPALIGTLATLIAVLAHFRAGDRAFAKAGQTLGTATGLDRIGTVRVFEQPHTAPNYLMREMIFHVGRKHARRLRAIALALLVLPALGLLILPQAPWVFGLMAALHLLGAAAQRWLFFAEAEHVVGLFYGQR
ncbi:dimethyl sulfoxide reductase anchor subunit [Rhodobacter sp. KR11]|uniref:dimethyl sulfoxide reductase anchor subunit family protein n=1 Tax=Rhodobacter sp. KR11 TaxID=2974588 RepID=UPI002223453F|nr:DmsC/YnfH family molybdoenzyme membrane anchor subunit [Rhodobacter sp. KR11]MCW1920370.1 dimethyl sulfoxide reductase anchor subunit [Rhodobacter sp. KR11]